MTLEQLAARVAEQLAPLRGKRLMIALSGGADSVALTLALCRLRDTVGWSICAAHVNHGLRGAESDGDQAFVEALCERYDLPLCCTRLSPPVGAGETWAREARYQALFDAARAQGCNVMVLAHHQDDQTETLLEHLLRGCGPEGLAGMRPMTTRNGMTLARPLLTTSRAELREALRDAGEGWREDATNSEAFCLRNRLRLELLPAMEALAPGAGVRMARAARLQGAEQQMLEDMEADFLRAYECGWRALPLAALRTLHPVMQGRVLRRWWGEQAAELPRLEEHQTEAFMALITASAGSRCNLPGDWHGERGSCFLHLVPPTVAGARRCFRRHAMHDCMGTVNVDGAGMAVGGRSRRRETRAGASGSVFSGMCAADAGAGGLAAAFWGRRAQELAGRADGSKNRRSVSGQGAAIVPGKRSAVDCGSGGRKCAED